MSFSAQSVDNFFQNKNKIKQKEEEYNPGGACV